ncbi:hypothetical protein BH18ACI5_BH18ACI5_15070 [soil metagenome]
MVPTKSELIASLQNEVRILLQLASKVDRAKLNYRPTEKQRSTLELLQYLTIVGPALLAAAKAGTIVNQVLCGCAAYRTQLFLYLKACGREDLGTANLWAGVDAPAAVWRRGASSDPESERKADLGLAAAD